MTALRLKDAGDCIGEYSTRLRQFGNVDPSFCIRCTGRSASYKMANPVPVPIAACGRQLNEERQLNARSFQRVYAAAVLILIAAVTAVPASAAEKGCGQKLMYN